MSGNPMNPPSPMNRHPSNCTKRRKDGQPCRARAIAGTDACRRHCGVNPAKARARGAVVLELARWGIDGHTEYVDPGEVLLRLVTQSAARCELYGRLLGQAFKAAERAERPGGEQAQEQLHGALVSGGVAALIGHRLAVGRDGGVYPVEEAIRGLARLEAEERDRCANFAAKAVAAGLAERQVRLAEQQGALVASVYRRAMERTGLPSETRAALESALVAEIQALTGGYVVGELEPANDLVPRAHGKDQLTHKIS